MLDNSTVLTVLLVIGWVIVALPLAFGGYILFKLYMGRDQEADKAKKEAAKLAKEENKAAKEALKNPERRIRKSATSLAPIRNTINSSREDVVRRIAKNTELNAAQAGDSQQDILNDLLKEEFDALPPRSGAPKEEKTSGFPPPPPKLGL